MEVPPLRARLTCRLAHTTTVLAAPCDDGEVLLGFHGPRFSWLSTEKAFVIVSLNGHTTPLSIPESVRYVTITRDSGATTVREYARALLELEVTS